MKQINIAKPARLAVAIAAVLTHYAHAQETKELAVTTAKTQTDSSYKVDQSTNHKYTQPLLDTAKTVTVINQSVMKERNVDNLRDALRGVSGISFAAGEGGTPTGDSMSIRGFSARSNIMTDGVREVAGYNRDTYNIEEIEVAKGPGSAMYGRGSAGGTINLSSKTAKLDDFTDVSLRVGSESDYRATLDANKKIGDTSALRINVLSDDGEVAGRDHVENSKNALAASFATGLGTDSRLSINADYQKQSNLPDYGLPWIPNYSSYADRTLHADIAKFEGQEPPVDFSNFYGNVNRDFEDIKAVSVTAKYEKDLSEQTMLRVLARTGAVTRQSVVNAPRFERQKINDINVYGEGARIGLGHQKTRDTEDSLAVIQADLVGNYTINGLEHDLVAGVEYAKETFERWNYQAVVEDNLAEITLDLYKPDATMAFTGKYARTDKSNKATGDTTAFFLFDTITFNPQWKLSAGVRYDIFDTEYYYDLAGDDPSVKLAKKDKELSWDFSVVYKPTENGSIYFGSGSSFSPSAEDLTASYRGNNAELDPEKTISYELGTKWQLFDELLSLNAAIFRTEKTHARTDSPFATDSRDDTLNGEQAVDGIELSAVGEINEHLSITAGYTYQDSEVSKAEGDDVVQQGQQLARTPKHSFSIWSNYELTPDIDIALGAQYMGERFNSSDPGGREKANDYLIFDIKVSYQVNPDLTVQLNGANLTDEEYADQIGGGHFVPGEGRYFSLTGQYSF